MSRAFFVVERPRVGMLQSFDIRWREKRKGVKESVRVGVFQGCDDRRPYLYLIPHVLLARKGKHRYA